MALNLKYGVKAVENVFIAYGPPSVKNPLVSGD
jgi:hypothetical protein